MERVKLTERERDALAVCPWCKITAGLYFDDNNYSDYYISCGKCGAEGPGGNTPVAAMERWNSWDKEQNHGE